MKPLLTKLLIVSILLVSYNIYAQETYQSSIGGFSFDLGKYEIIKNDSTKSKMLEKAKGTGVKIKIENVLKLKEKKAAVPMITIQILSDTYEFEYYVQNLEEETSAINDVSKRYSKNNFPDLKANDCYYDSTRKMIFRTITSKVNNVSVKAMSVIIGMSKQPFQIIFVDQADSYDADIDDFLEIINSLKFDEQ